MDDLEYAVVDEIREALIPGNDATEAEKTELLERALSCLDEANEWMAGQSGPDDLPPDFPTDPAEEESERRIVTAVLYEKARGILNGEIEGVALVVAEDDRVRGQIFPFGSELVARAIESVCNALGATSQIARFGDMFAESIHDGVQELIEEAFGGEDG